MVKILYISAGMHFKNHNALINYKSIDFYISDNIKIINSIDLSQFDCVYIPCYPIDINKYPNTKFIFGPHFSVFPENNHMHLITRSSNKVIYIQPSEWAANVWKDNPLCRNLIVESLPFGVETRKFIPTKSIHDRKNVFIYYKSRHPKELESLKNFLQNHNIDARIFSYTSKYSEEEFIRYLQDSKFGIWLGRHESQGFALEETLSCNVPLLVWNVTSMNQEYGYNYEDISATSIPYWDNRCGEYFHKLNELSNTYTRFIANLMNYNPREYILENLSMEVCEKKFINLINKT